MGEISPSFTKGKEIKMDDFKKETAVDYTAFDLNCRNIVPHDKQKNKTEKIIKRKARRKLKEKLKKDIDNCNEICYNINKENERK